MATRPTLPASFVAAAILAAALASPLPPRSTSVSAHQLTRATAASPPAMGRGLRPVTGARDPAWSPDGRRLALSVLDRLRVATADGRLSEPLVAWPSDAPAVERDPAWSADGRRLVFSADRGEGFDLFTVDARGGEPRRLTFLPGHERWPTWARDGRVVFSAEDGVQWDLYAVDPDAAAGAAPPALQQLTRTAHDEREPAIAPGGDRLVFVSDEDADVGETDIWTMRMPPRDAGASATEAAPEREPARRVVRAPGPESRPAWAPEGRRIVFAAVREGVGTMWTASVLGDASGRSRPSAPPELLSRRYGMASWSRDGETIVIADLPDPPLVFNGEARPRWIEVPPVFVEAYTLRTVPAPRPPDAAAQPFPLGTESAARPWPALFERVWASLRDRYYASGPAAALWSDLRARFGPRAAAAADAAAFERIVDDMVADQPLVNAPVSSRGAVVVSGHALASAIGARVLERGGNVADAAVAVSFALGVAEPDASGIGGDGMAIVWLASMPAPVVVDFKDQAPMRATLDNPRVFRDGTIVGDGPAAANIPGVVAGMDLLHRRFGSGVQSWADLVRPAASLAEEGVPVTDALATTLRVSRARFARHPAAADLYLPGGRPLRAGERLANHDLSATLTTIAREGAAAFYRGTIARQIAEDMAANGGLISLDDLAQYRAIEREPLRGSFRGRTVFAPPPPVAAGAALIETLQIHDQRPPTPPGRYAADADLLHYLVESWKAREPVVRIADPALWPVDLGDHLTRAHAARRFGTIDPRTAADWPPLPLDEEGPLGEEPDNQPGRGTTAFVVADAAGNIVVVTQTLSTWGGSAYVSEGLGFLYNNHLRVARTTPGAYGQLLPLMRSSSAALPTMLAEERDGALRPVLAVAAAGNAWIPASIYGILAALYDGQLGVQAAVEAPRFLVTRDPADRSGRRARVLIEDRFPRAVLDDLAARGHVFQKIGGKGELKYGFAAAVTIDRAHGLVHAGTDPRRPYAAAVVPPK